MNFHVGQRVKYVGPDFSAAARLWGQIAPKPGEVYTVRATGWIKLGHIDEAHIHLSEIHNKPYQWANGFCELAMNSKFFVPLIERGTDTGVAILRKVADDASKKRELTVCGND